MAGIVVVGAGQAGAALVAKLRAAGHTGAITLIGAEPVPPYQRPPLSKAYLLGEMALERLFLRPASFYAENDIALITGQRVQAIDPGARRVRLDGQVLNYDQLALTTGAVPRRLPPGLGGDLAGVHLVRSLTDVDRMAPEFTAGRRLVVVGGGYIGLEAAAVAVQRGLEVQVIEAAPRILQRVAAAETSDYVRALHRRHGVEIIEGVPLARLTGADGRVSGAELADGRVLAADFVICGIGVAPDIALAEAAGLTIDNGIATDSLGRTSAPHVWAAGDCASFPLEGARMRLESVQNAIDQAECVALDMLGQGAAYAPEPWFWSDQYDMKLQIAGLGTGHDRVVVRDGGAGRSHWYFSGARFIAVDAMNDPRAYMVGKRLLALGRSPDPEALSEPGTDLKHLLR
ncbi:MAG: FAD-dependent oxidoreductase [Rhodobacteraceae bacterium]|nr:FAD-dependent oxidoreductase [Paracoccaceae bacterium]